MEEDSFSCLKKCTCPADGSACTLSSVCNAQHFVCKPGYQRFSDGQTKCFKPGCAAGSLQEAVSVSVSNGHAYAVCTCSGESLKRQMHAGTSFATPVCPAASMIWLTTPSCAAQETRWKGRSCAG